MKKSDKFRECFDIGFMKRDSTDLDRETGGFGFVKSVSSGMFLNKFPQAYIVNMQGQAGVQTPGVDTGVRVEEFR